MHRPKDIRFRRLTHRVLLIVCERHHILPFVPEEFIQVRAHVLDVVDATAKLPSLAKVVDANQQCFPSPVAC